MTQIIQLSTQLPTGDMGRSIQSPRTNVLMQFELDRRRYNRDNGENVDLLKYLRLDRHGVLQNVDPVAHVLMGFLFFDAAKQYRAKKRGGIYSKKLKL